MISNLRRGLVDLSSVIWTCLKAGRDDEGKKYESEDGKSYFVNSAGYAYENAVAHINKAMSDLALVPRDLIFVMEGMNSKQDRVSIHPGYKAGRDKHPEEYVEFNLAKERVMQNFLDLGAQVCWQDHGVEADDVLGYLALMLKGIRYIISGDKDMAQLVGRDPNIHHYRQHQLDYNPFGPFDHHLIPTWIALVGDDSDKIPGAKGFGEKKAEKLLGLFGQDGLELMEGLILRKELPKLAEDVPSMKELQTIINDANGVYMSYELARLRIERVNTLKRPLQWRAGLIKPRAECEHEDLRKHAGAVKLIHAGNYDAALPWIKDQILKSPFVTLDIETSTPPESDEWLELQGKEEKMVDVFGSELTSLQLTFGPNMQFTVYLPFDNVEEAGVLNLPLQQIVDVVELIPREKFTVIHNVNFELPVCFNTWGKQWEAEDDVYHGYLRNVLDSAIMSSYVDENRSRGLKNLSKTLFDYDQVTYDAVTTKTMKRSEWDGKGRLLREFEDDFVMETVLINVPLTDPRVDMATVLEGDEHADVSESRPIEGTGTPYVTVQLKMNQLKASEVLAYGADDTICTAAAATHFMIIMEIEETWDVFLEVEQFASYLTAKAFVDGIPFSLQEMNEMQKDDDIAFDKAWPTLREYLMNVGFDGTVCPEFTEMSAANIKEAFQIIVGREMDKTLVRTPSKLAKLIMQQAPEEGAILALAVEQGDLGVFNGLVANHFKGEPTLDLNSSRQMGKLLYDVMCLPVHMINDCTPLEKEHKPDLARAVSKFKRQLSGDSVVLSDEEKALVRTKAQANDDALKWALAFHLDHINAEAKAALEAISTMKHVMTRRSLFYSNYRNALHWKDGLLHASINQCAAVTRRFSSSNPNVQQWPKKGEAMRFRACVKPHHRQAVVASVDEAGQELRLAAERSQDPNLLACYVGDNLKDVHSMTASTAMTLKWGAAKVKELFAQHGSELAQDEDGEYELFIRLRARPKSDPMKKIADDVRKDSKNVNFTGLFGGMPPTISRRLIMPLADAETFLRSRDERFPGLLEAASRAESFCKKHGYALTFMGARRHLAAAIASDDKWEASRAARQAWNFEIQSSAGEQIKLAMGRFWKSGALWKYDARFYAVIHDELVTSVHKDDALPFLKIKNECMTAPYANMKVPSLGSISVGPNFAEQIEVGDWFIEANITKALCDIFGEKVAA
jgi:5'-3' exonuclease